MPVEVGRLVQASLNRSEDRVSKPARRLPLNPARGLPSRGMHWAQIEAMERNERAGAGSEILGRAMARRGWSAPGVSRRTDGVASGSSVLAYASGQTLPSPSSAVAVAQALGREDGVGVLRAWGLSEMAEAWMERMPAEPLHRKRGRSAPTLPPHRPSTRATASQKRARHSIALVMNGIV